MHWKHWPYWINGGAIGLAIAMLFIWFKLQNSFGVICKIGKDCPSAWESFVSGEWVVVVVYVVIPALIIGFALGYLYGKFRNRKKLNSGFPLPRE